MADTVGTYTTETPERQVFRTKPKSMVSALALLVAGVLTFSMGITHYFFVEAMAWIFTLWGALLMYNHLSDFFTRYEVTDQALVIYTPVILWRIKRVWDWKHINRMDLVVDRIEAEPEDVEMQVYYTAEGSTVLHREDIAYNPVLAKIIAERAGLKAKRGQTMTTFEQIPQDNKATYQWQ